jgi:hypothetical protein
MASNFSLTSFPNPSRVMQSWEEDLTNAKIFSALDSIYTRRPGSPGAVDTRYAQKMRFMHGSAWHTPPLLTSTVRTVRASAFMHDWQCACVFDVRISLSVLMTQCATLPADESQGRSVISHRRTEVPHSGRFHVVYAYIGCCVAAPCGVSAPRWRALTMPDARACAAACSCSSHLLL